MDATSVAGGLSRSEADDMGFDATFVIEQQCASEKTSLVVGMGGDAEQPQHFFLSGPPGTNLVHLFCVTRGALDVTPPHNSMFGGDTVCGIGLPAWFGPTLTPQ